MSRGVTFDIESARRIGRSVLSTERRDKGGTPLNRPTINASDPHKNWIISGNSLVSANFWKYGLKEAKRHASIPGKWIIDTAGITILPTAADAGRNTWEGHNDGAGAEGMGAAVGAVGSATVTLLPIMDGVHVRARQAVLDGVAYWEFEAPNDRGVACG